MRQMVMAGVLRPSAPAAGPTRREIEAVAEYLQ